MDEFQSFIDGSLDFLFRLKDYIESLGTFVNNVNIGTLMDNNNSICLRVTPSSDGNYYLDGNKNKVFNFQILTRHENHQLSYKTMQALSDKLNALLKDEIKSNNNSFVFISCNPTTSNNFVERDNKGWIYTTIFNAELYINTQK